jgi:hypothetical protein
MIVAACSCGFRELDDEGLIDHLQLMFEPVSHEGHDGQVHEEKASLTCSCGLAAVTINELDQHFLKVFTPDDATGRDGQRHEATDGI